MPTEDTTSSTGSTEETSGQEQQDQQQQTTDETSGNGTQQQVSIDDSTQLPETHPLVKTLSANKTKLAAQNTELSELRAKSKKVTDLETELAARPSQEAVDTLQLRYDRLEAFLQASGGPLSKALDSRSFTTSLFETDKDIKDIVKEFNAANPTATSTALASSAAAPAGKSPSMNELLRSALK